MTDEHYGLEDFEFGEKLGEGATGEVFVVAYQRDFELNERLSEIVRQASSN